MYLADNIKIMLENTMPHSPHSPDNPQPQLAHHSKWKKSRKAESSETLEQSSCLECGHELPDLSTALPSYLRLFCKLCLTIREDL